LKFPFVLTTYRLTEHHTAGGMSRFLSHLAELQPEMFAEISPELARELKINNGDHICIVTLRGAIEARALVSRRIRPLRISGKRVHQVAVPYHYGTAGLVCGGAANDLLSISGEPNVTIMEAKALTCNIVPGRLPRGISRLGRALRAAIRTTADFASRTTAAWCAKRWEFFTWPRPGGQSGMISVSLGVAHASRVLASASSRSRTFPLDSHLCCGSDSKKRLFRRDAETSTRDACATQSGPSPALKRWAIFALPRSRGRCASRC